MGKEIIPIMWDDPLLVERLKIMWMQGVSAGQIARSLGHGITRNAVLGKAYCLGLPHRGVKPKLKRPPASVVRRSNEKHKEKKRVSNLVYLERLKRENPEKLRASYRRGAAVRRSRVIGNGGFIPLDWWTALNGLFETGVCLYCGNHYEKLVMDHFVPVRLGGRTEVGNLLPVCSPCNNEKRDKPPGDWVRSKCGDNGYGEIMWFLDVTREAYLDELAVAEVAA